MNHPLSGSRPVWPYLLYLLYLCVPLLACNGDKSSRPSTSAEVVVEQQQRPAPQPPAPKPPSAVDPRDLLAYDEADPLGDLESADAIAGPAPARAVAPDGPCREISPPHRITTADVRASIVSAGSGFVVAGYERKGAAEHVFVLTVPAEGLPRPLQTLVLEHPTRNARWVGPGMHAADAHHVSLAVTDGIGRLLLAQLQLVRGSAAATLREISTGLDTRFAPAVAHVDKGTLLAWTVGSTPMSTNFTLVAPDGTAAQVADITPPRQGSAAATFVDGAKPPVLLSIDARDGMSPLIRIAFDKDGVPGKPTPEGPVGMVSSAPELGAARASFGTVALYTGLGSAATSAVGMLSIGDKNGVPEALVRGTAYGRLHVGAVAAGDYLLLAADAPLAPGKDPPHEVQIARIAADGSRTISHLRGPGKDTSNVSIARSSGGIVAVTFQSEAGLYLARMRCD